jgi:putative PIN family toxin of toxin-antitoxin system
LLEEFVAVVSRPKFKNLITKEDIINILEIIENEAEYVEVTSQLDLCTDKKDNFLLSLAVDSKADFLITGDEDLLELKQIDKTNIITIRDFLSNIHDRQQSL